MEGKRIVVNIPVTAEDGTTKTYTLIINALPDNVNLLSVKVEGKEPEPVPRQMVCVMVMTVPL
jgi:hypothetical protein